VVPVAGLDVPVAVLEPDVVVAMAYETVNDVAIQHIL
jgi:hypothetical protein